MQFFQVFDYFNNEKHARGWWPLPPGEHDSISLMTAMVKLSGTMATAKDETDLRQAVELTMEMIQAGELTTWSVSQESEQIEADMERWYGKQLTGPPC